MVDIEQARELVDKYINCWRNSVVMRNGNSRVIH
ncbi:MAG: hypothetical protein KatS3mg003_2290 [Candidatus Nitrosocaldaceae archaeon]|nr:MAG: hypothetical protein KatS3mg003_2290 [Candidatus Nitrosocaldaceae archaeon]